MFGFDEKDEDEARGDISAARDYFLKELDRGPFAPALSGELLARFSIEGSLANFVRTHLPEACFLGTVGNLRQSPVGKPALALTAKIRDVKYWQAYRLSNLYTAWPDVEVDISALDRPVVPVVVSRSALTADAAEFEKQFPIGRHIRGRVTRRAFRVPGYVLSVDGESITTAFLPESALTESDRALGDGMIGLSGLFEVISTRPAKRSVWVRRLSAAAAAAVAAQKVQSVVVPAVAPSNDGVGDDIELRLKRAQNLYSKGLITEAEYKATREKIISSL